MGSILIKAFFDEPTNTVTYVVSDNETLHCCIIDSVLNFDQFSGRTSTRSADDVIKYIEEQNLSNQYILETHAHADHLSAACYLKQQVGGEVGIGCHIVDVQRVFKDVFHLEPDFKVDGSQFDILLEDSSVLQLGKSEIKILHVPGHTPACIAYSIDDAVFVGDTLFMPDFGTARCDFPGGDAKVLYKSIKRLLDLPANTRLFTCHDYKANGRDVFAWESSVTEQRKNNIHINDSISEQAFIKFRRERDGKLSIPKLILPSVQVNIRAGQLPAKEENGVSYLKLPIDWF